MTGEAGPKAPIQSGALSLRAIDRCDRCGARAACRATKIIDVLLLCMYHAGDHQGALLEQGWRVEYPPIA